MKKIDHATVQRILDSADIVDVVSDFVTLKRRGSGYLGLCPFHNERTPSFSVSRSKGICKCFSCGKGGSAVNFIMEIEKLSYYDALRWLAKKYNIEIQEHEMTDKEREEETERESMLAVNDWALKHFEHNLHETADGVDIGKAYFIERGISEPMMKKFRLGYALDRRDALYNEAMRQGYTEKYLISTGLCAKPEGQNQKAYDRFRGRVIYPVFSVAGKVVAFGGRTLRSDKTMAKYVNSPESVIYSKSNQLYGLYQAKNKISSSDKCYLVEGYMDVISMYQSGVENVVASSGTSLTIGQIRLLRRFTKNVTVIYDSDAAGIKASLRGIDLLLAEGMNVKVLQFPEGDDPDSFAQNHTTEELEQYLATHEVDFMHFKTSILLKDVANDPIKRAQVISDIVQSIAVIPELITRTVYIGECSRMMGIDEKVISRQVAANRAKNAERDATEEQRRKARESIADIENSSLEVAEKPVTPNTSTAPMKETPKDDSGNYLSAYEKEVLRYVLKYGMSRLDLMDDTGNEVPITVIQYVTQEMELDDIHFVDKTVTKAFEAARELSMNSWDEDYNNFMNGLESKRIEWLREGREQIIAGNYDLASINAAEKKLEETIEERISKEVADFESDYISKALVNCEDDDVRKVTTNLVMDKYVLSAVHTRFGAIATERDRLEELVERAVYEWKDAILDVQIKQINDEITSACGSGTSNFEKVRELMAEKTRMLEIKRSFAKFLGERIIAPRKI